MWIDKVLGRLLEVVVPGIQLLYHICLNDDDFRIVLKGLDFQIFHLIGRALAVLVLHGEDNVTIAWEFWGEMMWIGNLQGFAIDHHFCLFQRCTVVEGNATEQVELLIHLKRHSHNRFQSYNIGVWFGLRLGLRLGSGLGLGDNLVASATATTHRNDNRHSRYEEQF